MAKIDIILKIAEMQETLNEISKAVIELPELELTMPAPNASLTALLKVGEQDG